jgi:hypothetical protein
MGEESERIKAAADLSARRLRDRRRAARSRPDGPDVAAIRAGGERACRELRRIEACAAWEALQVAKPYLRELLRSRADEAQLALDVGPTQERGEALTA